MVRDDKIVDALMTEYKEWLSRGRYWVKLVMQSVTILLAVSALSVSVLGSKESLYLLTAVLSALAALTIVPSVWIYFWFRKTSMKRLREIEETLDKFGIHLGYQRTFDNVPIPKHKTSEQS